MHGLPAGEGLEIAPKKIATALKWEVVCMNFISCLSKIKQSFNVILAVVDIVIKTTHSF